MQDKIAQLEKTIKKQGNRISLLKKNKEPLPDSEYLRLYNRIKISEDELLAKEYEYLQEIEELKNEISELLEIISFSEEVRNEYR
jgi:hypothetical protein